MQHFEGSNKGAGLRIAIVVAKFNDFVTDLLLTGALDALAAAGVASDDISLVKVPGAFEIPFAAKILDNSTIPMSAQRIRVCGDAFV